MASVNVLIVLDQTNPAPLYAQIAGQIKRKVLTGAVVAGEKLPSIRQLAAQLVTSVITTKRAYEELEAEGLIVTRPGIGSVVAELSDADRERLRRAEISEKLRGVATEAKALGFDKASLMKLWGEVVAETDEGDDGESH